MVLRRSARAPLLKGKPSVCQFLLHFTTYFPNVSYANSSKRRRKEDSSNEGKKKQGRRQEEKEGATRDGEDERRERTANGRERKRTKATSACEILVSQG